MQRLETDYLVVGGGAAGMAFTDALVAASDADVLIVDRRHRPGGHWHDAYPFVRLHQPSAYYGVNSRRLGEDAIAEDGPEAGHYERAGGAAVRAYFEQVLDDDLAPSGRVRFIGMSDHLGADGDGHWIASRLTGERRQVRVRRKVVDARHLEATVPATHSPAFRIGDGARVVPVGALAALEEPFDRYVVLGSGKTAMDACVFLLAGGVDPDRIRWVRPRDPWLLDRAGLQPLEQVGSIVEGFSLDLEAVAHAESLDELFDRLEDSGRLLRIDRNVTPTMYRCAIVSRAELEQLRRVEDVVRLGRVQRIDAGTIVLEGGSLATDARHLHVDCTAAGLSSAPVRPVFEPGRVTIQQVRPCTPSFNAALIGHVEATRDDAAAQNRLCPPTPQPRVPGDWVRNLAVTAMLARTWRKERDVTDWLEHSRLNLLRGVTERLTEPRVREALERTQRNRQAASAGLQRLLAQPQPAVR